jgi:hypothetical protein
MSDVLDVSGVASYGGLKSIDLGLDCQDIAWDLTAISGAYSAPILENTTESLLKVKV